MTSVRILVGHVIDKLRDLPEGSVQCVVTSPPYWGLRDYGTPPQVWGDGWRGNLGLEPTPELYVAHIVEVFREIRRVLRNDGTLFLNLGDSYASVGRSPRKESPGVGAKQEMGAIDRTLKWHAGDNSRFQWTIPSFGTDIKPKDMVGIPWAVAFALRNDGWWLRNAIVWAKPNPMPESVTDRCTTSYEFVFLLAKSARYYYDAEAIKEPCSENTHSRGPQYHRMEKTTDAGMGIRQNTSWESATWGPVSTRNKRDCWIIPTAPYKGAHFATFPEALVEPCIKAGTSEKGCCPKCRAPWQRVVEKTDTTEIRDEATGKSALQDSQAAARRLWERTRAMRAAGYAHDQPFPGAITRDWRPTCSHDLPPVPCQVLDPFLGSGTTAVVAQRLGRDCIGIELNPEYAEMARQRIEGVQPVELPGDNGDRLVVEQATMFDTVEVESAI